MHQVAQRLLNDGLMILERGASPQEVSHIVPALHTGGIRIFEVTFSPLDPDCTENGKRAIAAAVKAAATDMMIGAGTVLTAAQVQAAHDAGACFVVAPNTNRSVIEEAKRFGMAVIPGALTPTEITAAWDMGADMVKLFPADGMGMAYIRNLRGPLPHIPLLANRRRESGYDSRILCKRHQCCGHRHHGCQTGACCSGGV